MGHTFDPDRAHLLEEIDRYAVLSRDELVDAISPAADGTVLDLGSGTGFYTDDVAPHVHRLVAVDLQPAMHRYYREKGVPDTVSLVVAEIGALPIPDGAISGAFSTMTYHEFAEDTALRELARVIQPGGRLVVADWTASGSGDRGPPLVERFTADEIATVLESAGFTIERAADRLETAFVVAIRRD